MAVSNSLGATLVHIALAKGYFQAEGLDVTPQVHTSGKACLDAVLSGRVDLATVADTPIVNAALEGKRFSILAEINTATRMNGIAARRDGGIATGADLKGKVLGVTPGTTSAFFADLFLNLHGLRPRDVSLVPLPPEAMAPALLEGRVDAVSTWQPHLTRIRNLLGDRGLLFYNDALYTFSFCLVAREGLTARRPEAVRRVLRALVRAEELAAAQPEEARRLTAEFTKTERPLLDQVWGLFVFRTTLSQALLVNLEDQARWRKGQGLLKTTKTPDFPALVESDFLDSVKPGAVKFIR